MHTDANWLGLLKGYFPPNNKESLFLSLSPTPSSISGKKSTESSQQVDIQTTSGTAHYLHNRIVNDLPSWADRITRGVSLKEAVTHYCVALVLISICPKFRGAQGSGSSLLCWEIRVSEPWCCLPHLLRTLDLYGEKAWLFLCRERGSILEEEVGSLTSGSKQGLGKFQR